MITHHEGIPRERDHAFPAGPLFVPDAWISHDGVREMGLPLLRNQTNLELPYWHTAMGAMYVGAHPCTRLQLQDIVRLIERPNTGKRGIQVLDNGLRTVS
jgi:hypothetical protein